MTSTINHDNLLWQIERKLDYAIYCQDTKAQAKLERAWHVVWNAGYLERAKFMIWLDSVAV